MLDRFRLLCQVWWRVSWKKLVRACRWDRLLPGQPSGAIRFRYLITGIVLPLLCYGYAIQFEQISPHRLWQSGHLSTYVALLLSWPTVGIFLPLKLFAMACLGIWLYLRKEYPATVVSLGILVGLVLSLQVFILAVLHTAFYTLLAAAIFLPCFALVVYLSGRILSFSGRGQFALWNLFLAMTLAAVLAAIMVRTKSFELVIFAFFVALLAAPTLALITYCRVFLTMLREGYFRLGWRTGIAGLGLIGAWLLSWRLAVASMLDAYSKLPVNDPNCYVSSAAAHGHRWLVRSQVVVDAIGNERRSNSQMRYCKFLELFLAATWPWLHRRIRGHYDRFGPPLARLCRTSSVMADLGYLAMSPWTAVAWLLFRLLRLPKDSLEKLYR
jgi:hypothetical protein